MKNVDCEKARGKVRRWYEDLQKCQNDTPDYANKIFPDMICGEVKKRPKGKPTSTCKGDSGGPYTVKRGKPEQHFLVGVMSWQYGCAEVIVKTQPQLTQTQPTLTGLPRRGNYIHSTVSPLPTTPIRNPLVEGGNS